jgi:hypothetical protein
MGMAAEESSIQAAARGQGAGIAWARLPFDVIQASYDTPQTRKMAQANLASGHHWVWHRDSSAQIQADMGLL